MATTMQAAFADAAVTAPVPKWSGRGFDGFTAHNIIILQKTLVARYDLTVEQAEEAAAEALCRVLEADALGKVELHEDQLPIGLLLTVGRWTAAAVAERGSRYFHRRQTCSLEALVEAAGERALADYDDNHTGLRLKLAKQQVWHLYKTTTMDYEQIAKFTGVKATLVRELLRGWTRQGERRPKAKRQNYWTQDRIIEALQKWAARHGRSPRCSEATKDRTLPSHSSVRLVFGSWNRGLEAAGLEAGRAGYPKQDAQKKRTEIATRIHQWVAEHGRWPGQEDLGGDLPGSKSVQRWFGTNSRSALREQIEEVLDPSGAVAT